MDFIQDTFKRKLEYLLKVQEQYLQGMIEVKSAFDAYNSIIADVRELIESTKEVK